MKPSTWPPGRSGRLAPGAPVLPFPPAEMESAALFMPEPASAVASSFSTAPMPGGPPAPLRKRGAWRAGRRPRPPGGLKAGEHERARGMIQRLFDIRLHHRVGVRRLCRIIVEQRGGALPMDRLEQLRMVRRFIGGGAARPHEPVASHQAEHDCSLPMLPLKPPGIAMREAMRRAREYHAHPGWFERYGGCGVPRSAAAAQAPQPAEAQ